MRFAIHPLLFDMLRRQQLSIWATRMSQRMDSDETQGSLLPEVFSRYGKRLAR
jgi:hypothetical protein